MIESMKIPVLSCALAVLCGCAAGPGAKSPDALAATQKTATAQAELRKLVSARDIATEWRVLFRSPQISEHVNRAFKANPNTEAVQSTMRRAQEHAVIRQGFLYSRGGNPPLQISHAPEGDGQACYNLHIAQLTVGYVPAVLIGNRGSAESAQTQAEAQQEAAYFTLSSNVVAASIQEASLRAQIEAQLNIIGLNRQVLEIVHNQFKLGYVSEQDVTQRELDAANAQQALVPLQQRLDQTRDLLQMLSGNLPDPDADTEDAFRLDELRLSKELPLSLSSRLVEQRPDVRAAEAQLRSAGAQYGVDIVNALPRFTITSATGGPAASPTWMLRDGGRFFDLNGNAAQFIFGASVVRSKPRAAQQALNKAAVQYRSVVTAALQDVADTLSIIQTDVRALDAAAQSAQSTGGIAELTRKRYESGFVDFPTMRIAQQNEQLAIINLAQAQANQLGDAVALFQALGGRWWKADETDKAKAKSP